jgi:hypothetical protein
VFRAGRGRNDQGANISPMVIMLCMKVWQAYQDSPVKPPVTFAMAAYNIAAHVYPALAMPFSLSRNRVLLHAIDATPARWRGVL